MSNVLLLTTYNVFKAVCPSGQGRGSLSHDALDRKKGGSRLLIGRSPLPRTNQEIQENGRHTLTKVDRDPRHHPRQQEEWGSVLYGNV